MVVTIKYYNSGLVNVVDEYLGVVNVVSTTGAALYEGVTTLLESVGINLDNLVGYGSNNASAVAGTFFKIINC